MLDTQRKELWGTLLDGRYSLGRPLGCGATGVVLSARDERGRPVAIKLLNQSYAADAELAGRLRGEARVSCVVRHPGLAECLGEGVLPDGSPYVVFERVEGESLLSLLTRGGRLAVGEALVIGQRVARILSAVHRAGFVHRDVKPEHIVLSAQGLSLTVRLLDFGVCQGALEERGRKRFAVYGTPGYASPEQVAAELVDGRSDLFALGATLYEALSGRAPFQGANPAAILTSTLSDTPAPLSKLRPDCPRALESLIMQLLSRDPYQRPQGAHLLAREFTRCSDSSLELSAEALCGRLMRGLPRLGCQDDQSPTRRVRAVG